jgi:acetyl-CoA C-acetyltransferase
MIREIIREPDVAIVDGVRTPTGRLLGQLSEFEATELGSLCLGNLGQRLDSQKVDEAVLGTVIQAGQGQAPARQATLGADWSPKIPAVTINKVCGSGIKAILQAREAIEGGPANRIVAGGMESMSNAPHFVSDYRDGRTLGDGSLQDAAVHDGLWCSLENEHMGQPAERIAERYGLGREVLDEYALRSHRRAAEAEENGDFQWERMDVNGQNTDEPVRPDTSLDQLGNLEPAFREDGVVTAGNAPGLNDGACVLSVASLASARSMVESLNRDTVFTIEGYTIVGEDPGNLFETPAGAIELLLEGDRWTLNDFDRIEINEAFASQILGNCHRLELDPKRINQWGGAIALGHPIGMSGARIVLTLMAQLESADEQLGLASICMGGGNGIALVIRRRKP